MENREVGAGSQTNGRSQSTASKQRGLAGKRPSSPRPCHNQKFKCHPLVGGAAARLGTAELNNFTLRT